MTGPWFPGAHCPRLGGKAALVRAGTEEALTYGEVDAMANRLSHLLRARGLRHGDHVSFWFTNDVSYPALWWGAHYAGLHYTLISSRLTVAEAGYIVEDSESQVVLMGADLAAGQPAAATTALGPRAEILVADDGPDGLWSILRDQPANPLPDRVEGAAMLYSSGTTGRPKGVKRSLSDQPLGTAPGVALLAQIVFGMTEESVYLSPAPLYHAAPFGFVSATTAMGATAVIADRFDPEQTLRAIEHHRITHAQFVPTMLIRLLALSEKAKRRYDLSSLRYVIHAGAPCPVEVKDRMLDWLGPIVHEYYSGTEGAGFVYCSPEDSLTHRGSVGRALAGEIHVVDDDGHELPPGEQGTVYFSGGIGFEYHNDSAKTKESYLPNGWATLGDVGYLDEEGFLYLTDRRSNMIITGGVNVYPQEAENVLAVHPAVQDVAVIGVPHPDLGEEVKAVVQPVENAVVGLELEAELLAYCRQRIADVKCPRSVEFRGTLPREPTGKLLKRLLRDEYWRGRSSRLV